MSKTTYFRKGSVLPFNLAATAFLAFVTAISLVLLPFEDGAVAEMRLSPQAQTLILGDTFTVELIVESTVPVNVFAGELTFDPQTFYVESIDYNTSIADLWAEKPWYSNGEGTLTFAGGTTQKGGFTGTDSLITINFKTVKEGSGSLVINDAKVLMHDGLGTEAQLSEPIDALFTVQEQQATSTITNLLKKTDASTSYAVVPLPPSTDLNGDGKQSIADTSIFLLNMSGGDSRFDFNLDGKVNLVDFNILMGTR